MISTGFATGLAIVACLAGIVMGVMATILFAMMLPDVPR